MSVEFIVICTDCPCLNNDMEDGGSCNLGYESCLEFMGENGEDLRYVSTNCKLVEVASLDSKFVPKVVACYRKVINDSNGYKETLCLIGNEVM